MGWVMVGWAGLLGAFDLLDAKGRPQFSKLATVAVLVLSVTTGTFDLWFALAVLASSYGRSAFLSFLNRATVSESTVKTTGQQTTTNVSATVDASKILAALKAQQGAP